jgi:hypothetical protein
MRVAPQIQIPAYVWRRTNSPEPAFPTNLPFSITARPCDSTVFGMPVTLIPSNME